MLPGTEITEVVFHILPDSHLDCVLPNLPVHCSVRQHDLLTVLPVNLLGIHQQRRRDSRVYSLGQEIISLGQIWEISSHYITSTLHYRVKTYSPPPPYHPHPQARLAHSLKHPRSPLGET